MFVRQSWSLSLKHIPIPFSSCQHGMFTSNAFCWTVLKSKLDNGSPCLVPFLISNMLVSVQFLQEMDAIMFDTARFEGVPNWFVGDGVERLHEVDCRGPHFDSPLMAFLINHSVRRKMVCCLVRASESRLIFRLDLVKSWIQSAPPYCREQFAQRWQRTDRAVISNIFHVSFVVYHFYSHFSPCLCGKFTLFYDFVEDLRRMLWCLRLWFRCCLQMCLFLSLLIAVSNSPVVISGILSISLVSLFCTSVLLSFSLSSFSCSISSCSWSSYNF